jgi:hypothetical protein
MGCYRHIAAKESIVAATSNMRLPSMIKVWVYKATPPATAITKNANGALDKLVNIVVLFAALVFVFANFDYVVRNYTLNKENPK